MVFSLDDGHRFAKDKTRIQNWMVVAVGAILDREGPPCHVKYMKQCHQIATDFLLIYYFISFFTAQPHIDL
jgi:hypothetical protein